MSDQTYPASPDACPAPPRATPPLWIVAPALALGVVALATTSLLGFGRPLAPWSTSMLHAWGGGAALDQLVLLAGLATLLWLPMRLAGACSNIWLFPYALSAAVVGLVRTLGAWSVLGLPPALTLPFVLSGLGALGLALGRFSPGRLAWTEALPRASWLLVTGAGLWALGAAPLPLDGVATHTPAVVAQASAWLLGLGVWRAGAGFGQRM